jgi:hypothetical protein
MQVQIRLYFELEMIISHNLINIRFLGYTPNYTSTFTQGEKNIKGTFYNASCHYPFPLRVSLGRPFKHLIYSYFLLKIVLRLLEGFPFIQENMTF